MSTGSQTHTGQDRLQQALNEFTNVLSIEEKRKLFTSSTAKPSASDIVSLTTEIDQAQSRKSKKLGSRFRPFLNSIQQFSAVVDTFTQSNPEVSSLIWGSVKIALLVAMNFFEYFEKLSQMFMELGGICPILQDYQLVFPDEDRLQRALSEFYAVVIDFCKEVVAFLRQNGMKKFIKIAWKPFKVQFEDIQTNLTTRRENIDMEIRLASDKAAKNERLEMCLYRKQGLQHRLFEIKEWENSGKWRLQQDEKQKRVSRELLLARVSDYNYQAMFARKRNLRQEGTGTWLFKDKAFKKWKEGDSSILWCHGIPGSGKTILATGLIDELFKDCMTGQNKYTIAYFFCDFQDRESLEPQTILRALTKQILSLLEPLPDEIENALRELAGQNSLPPTLEFVQSLLVKAIESTSATDVYLVLDGLDECSDDDRHAILSRLLKLVSGDIKKRKVRIFLSSRKEMDLSKRLENSANCRQIPLLAASNVSDIADYVEVQLVRLDEEKRLVVSKTMRGEIKSELSKNADGMFLWVAFQLQEMCYLRSEHEIRERLRSLPRGLNKTYQLILDRISQDRDPGTAIRVFKWIAGAKRPLTLAELGEGMAFSLGDTRHADGLFASDNASLLRSCGNLVVIEAGGAGDEPTLRFAHFTVMEFLASGLTDISDFHLSHSSANEHVMEICLTYLSFADFERQITIRGPEEVAPIVLEKPVTEWAAKAIEDNGSAPWLWKTVTAFRGGKATEKSGVKPEVLKRLIIPALSTPLTDTLGGRFRLLPYCVTYWLEHSREISRDTSRLLFRKLMLDRPFSPGTIIACFFPWSGELEGQGGGATLEGKDRIFSAFRWAFQNDHKALLELTLNPEYSDRNSTVSPPFTTIRRENLQTMMLELARQAGHPDGDVDEIMVNIISLGYLNSAKLLLEYLVQSPDGIRGHMDPQAITTTERERIIKCVQRGASAAASVGHVEILGCFLDVFVANFLQIKMTDISDPAHPLVAAVAGDQVKAIKLFANREYFQLLEGYAPFHACFEAAVKKDSVPILDALFQVTAMQTSPRLSWALIFLIACRGGYTASAEFLLERSNLSKFLNVNSFWSAHGEPPLIEAAMGGRAEMVAWLVGNGADVNLRHEGATALERLYERSARDRFLKYKMAALCDVAETLVKLGATDEPVPGHPSLLSRELEAVSWATDSRMLQILLQAERQRPRTDLVAALKEAVLNSNFCVTRELLTFGVPVQAYIEHPSLGWGRLWSPVKCERSFLEVAATIASGSEDSYDVLRTLISSLKLAVQAAQVEGATMASMLADSLAVACAVDSKSGTKWRKASILLEAIAGLGQGHQISIFSHNAVRYLLKCEWEERTGAKSGTAEFFEASEGPAQAHHPKIYPIASFFIDSVWRSRLVSGDRKLRHALEARSIYISSANQTIRLGDSANVVQLWDAHGVGKTYKVFGGGSMSYRDQL